MVGSAEMDEVMKNYKPTMVPVNIVAVMYAVDFFENFEKFLNTITYDCPNHEYQTIKEEMMRALKEYESNK